MGNKYWIDVASHDIEACKVLRDNKLYAQSLFYFQQSVEKCSKYIGLEIGGFSNKELKEISHNPIKLFKKMAEKIFKTAYLFAPLSAFFSVELSSYKASI